MSRVLIYQRKSFNSNDAENVDPVRGRGPPPGIPIPGIDRQINALRPR